MQFHLLIVSVVLLAGCAAPALPGGTPSEVTPETPSSEAVVSGGTTPLRDTITPRTTTPSTLDAAVNPWGHEVVTVSWSSETVVIREFTPLVEQALAYWNGDASAYAAYPVTFEYVARGEADLLITFVDEVPDCGEAPASEWTAGCAPLIDDTHPPPAGQPVVYVKAAYNNESTLLVLQHELGHVLGIEHGEPPASVMSPESDLAYLPLPDATDRELPWQHPTLSVYVDYSGVDPADHPAVEAQIGYATDYYAGGVEGYAPANVSFTAASEPTDADIVISFPERTSCGSTGSCASRTGYDLDDDGALEYYTRLDIEVSDLDVEVISWHVGYWLAAAFGAETEADRPPPFRNADYDDRREWWQ